MSPGTVARRFLGGGLIASGILPLYRVLADPATGPAGRSTVELADVTLSLVGWSSALVVGVALVLGRGLPALDPGPAAAGLNQRLARVPTGLVPVLAALAAGAFCLTIGRWAFQGYPTLLDEMAQLLQARFFQVGLDAGPSPHPAAAWLIQNTLVTDAGWVSQYPPFHTLLLSLGLDLGTPWLVGPVLTAVTVFFGARVAAHLFPDRTVVVVWAGCALAASPFLLALGAGFLSHVSAAALGTAGLWWGLRARDGGARWALAAGLCAGLLVATRPLTGVALACVFLLVVWIPEARSAGRGLGWLATRLGLAGLGSLPGGLWLASYNRALFGGPFTFGYSVAQGPAHGLGFHPDPWGNAYGPIEAVGYTAADLLQLGVHLLETPIPLVAVVGAYLLLARTLSPSVRILLAWALLPVLANAFYWHHGYHLGPRMLYETTPAWLLLSVIAVDELIQMAPEGWPRRSVLWATALSLAGAAFLGVPGRMQAYRWHPDTVVRMRVPSQSATSLVFVHGGWSGRLTAQLQGLGMRLDSVETAIRRNDACAVHEYVEARRNGLDLPELDLRALPGDAPGLTRVPAGDGSVVRTDPSRPHTPPCRRQSRADRMGVAELAPLLWQGDLPGVESGRAVFVRDLGPEGNRDVRVLYPGRPAYLFTARTPGGPPEMVPYEQGMRLLWGDGARDG